MPIASPSGQWRGCLTMKIDIMTLFPDMCRTALGESIIGRAQKKGLLDIAYHQIRDYTTNRQNQVDDYPFGGGQGMIMNAQPIVDCFRAVCAERGERPYLIYMSPQGKTLTQQRARELAQMPGFCVLCGHYEGIDERVIESIVDEEISIGDYVLTGGELPALVLVDCVARMVPGVLSEEACFTDESHYSSLLEYPQYTRPAEFEGRCVPEVLLSGHHANIAKWRRQQSLLRTLQKRPELLQNAELDKADIAFLQSIDAQTFGQVGQKPLHNSGEK